MAIAPSSAIKIYYGLVCSFSIPLRIIDSGRGTITTHSASLRNIVEVSLEIAYFFFPRIHDIDWKSGARRYTASIKSSRNFSKAFLAPTITPWILYKPEITVRRVCTIPNYQKSMISDTWSQTLLTVVHTILIGEEIRSCLKHYGDWTFLS
jgi:hypothetical protein